ncbi:hypothetical protein D1B33_11100 [Lysinibacillus yapensis]|uniref:Lipoprotein n=1 Tax=Ureibacillus yapensis TaxID=2304605 RepID=A0A396S6A2_9BACL|nr:hypothetical protein [Lysinibacillus yapensis]RHW36179.1 hypothetical protein D1B33_11100 [Lysinibacillus yapensis]
MKKRLFLSLLPFVFLVGCTNSPKEEEEPKTVVKEESKETQSVSGENKTSTETETASSIPEENLADSFSAYLDDISVLAPEEARIIELYDGVTGVNYTNDDVLYTALLDEIIPAYRDFVAELESIMPQNPQIRELHEVYIEAANIQYNSFIVMVSALEEQDSDKITEANQGLDQARKLLRDWLYEVESIASETGVALQ